MDNLLRMKTGESMGKLIWPDIENVIEETPKGDLESILSTARFAAINAINNIHILVPWLSQTIIGKYQIEYKTFPHYIVSHVRIEATQDAGIVAAVSNIVSLVTLLDMFKSVTKNVYISDIITSSENYNIRQITPVWLPVEGVYLEAHKGDTFPISLGIEIPHSIGLKSVIIKEYDMLQMGDLWLEIISDSSGLLLAKALSDGAATITDHAFLIRGIKK